jgi:hypothetical protein
MKRIVVVGGGIAGVEAALTLTRTLTRAHVTLVSQWKSLRMLPQLVYVPFGASSQSIDIPLGRALAPAGIDLQIGTCQHIDIENHSITTDMGDIAYDALVVAPGTLPEPTNAYRLRTLQDALRLRTSLEDLERSTDAHRSIMLRVPSSCTWAPPAFEFALLLAAWRDERSLNDIRITVAVEDSNPLDQFDPHASTLIIDRLADNNVELLTNVPNHRLDLMESSIAIEFGMLIAHRVPGLPPLNADGFYEIDSEGFVAQDAFVIGDAANTSYKGAFATGWHARRVAMALGGDLSVLGERIEGIPVDECEYQMDLGNDTLAVRLSSPEIDYPIHDLRPTKSEIRVGQAEKLVGTLTHELLRREASRMQIKLAIPHSA